MSEILNLAFAVVGYAVAWYVHARPSSPLAQLLQTLEAEKQKLQAHTQLQDLAAVSQQILRKDTK
jgi:hypothetical protein